MPSTLLHWIPQLEFVIEFLTVAVKLVIVIFKNFFRLFLEGRTVLVYGVSLLSKHREVFNVKLFS